MKLNGSETTISARLQNQMRMLTSSMVNANVNRRRGSSRSVWCMFHSVFSIFYSATSDVLLALMVIQTLTS